MKTFFLSVAVVGIMLTGFAQTNDKKEKKQTSQANSNIIYRGEKITDEGVITPAELLEKMKGNEKMEAKVVANVLSCCQERGCWMMVDLGNGEQMRVTFKDYGFFVPKESAGKKVIMQGVAYYKTTSVEQLRHYAKDAGKTKEEIAAITEPEHKLAFEASGVILK